MTPEQQAAYIIAQSACAMAEIAGMQAANQQCIIHRAPPIYNEQSFADVPVRLGIHHNATIEFFRR